ncbi:acylneuraminate cytidylyltransferase family protein [uncultured Roseivirga sp.]|uniref:acylneuraminate cytidylyltransferase family protein n=1 Tax=uncultured Roseivirga sp. TaxID=543088 RepID=UPI0030DD1C18|tara:strand:+ start:706 stop:1422 length:717 start_codon:yes stop_codon:yes gene_type:complete
MNLLITICARGGSKGIPGKNIKLLNGRPLLHYTLSHAQQFADVHKADIQISTDSDEILACAAEMGYSTNYQRPLDLASDTAGKIDVIKHVWEWAENELNKKYDYVLDLDVTSPLRTQSDLTEALSIILAEPRALNIFSVSPAARNPYFNIVELNADGFATVCKSNHQIKSRQQAPKVYDMNASFYVFSREFMEGDYSRSTTERSLIHVMKHVCFDLDEPIDFKVLEIMLKEKLIDFSI